MINIGNLLKAVGNEADQIISGVRSEAQKIAHSPLLSGFASAASQVISGNAIPGMPSSSTTRTPTDINLPGKTQLRVPSLGGLTDQPVLPSLGKYSPTIGGAVKGLAEFPEMAVKTVQQTPGILKAGIKGEQLPKEATTPAGPGEVGSMFQDQVSLKNSLKQSGLSDSSATYLSMLNSALTTAFIVDGGANVIDSAAKELASGGVVNDRAVVEAWHGLGSPKDMNEAAVNFRQLQHMYHPDSPMSLDPTGNMSSTINNAWKVLQEGGIPSIDSSFRETIRGLARSLITDRTLENPFPEFATDYSKSPYFGVRGQLPEVAGTTPTEPFQPMREPQVGMSARDIKAKPLEGETPATQKEQVAAAAEKPKSIKQIAEETAILEPNVRRILGVGAKEGTFERVDKGVYRYTGTDGKETAYVQVGDALDVLPQLVAKGVKTDMVFLDIPYSTKAVKGGNRGVKYDLITPEQFGQALDSIGQLTKGPESPIYFMYSTAKSGIRDMMRYADQLTARGYLPVASGEYSKLTKAGARTTNMTGHVDYPEGIILMNKTGQFSEYDAPRNLNFSLQRPPKPAQGGYPSEKPGALLQSLILQGSKAGDVVLDPFSGSGVTAAEAIKAGRRAIAIEKDPAAVANFIRPRIEAAIREKFPELANSSEGKAVMDGIIEEQAALQTGQAERPAAPTPVERVFGPRPEEPALLKVRPESQVVAEAEVQALADGFSENGYGPLAGTWQKALIDLMRARKIANFDRYIIETDLKADMGDDAGLEDMKAIQSGSTDPKYKRLRALFADTLKQLNDNDIKVPEKENYLTQYFVNPEAQIRAAMGKSISLHAPFEMKSAYASYEAGIEAGLTPRYTNPAQIAGAYYARAQKLIADKKFFEFMADNGFVQVKKPEGSDWMRYDEDRFPKIHVESGAKEYTGSYWGPPDVVEAVNNYLKETTGFWRSVADITSTSKNVVLTGGIPGTGFNFHGWTTLFLKAFYSDASMRALYSGIIDLANPGLAHAKLLASADKARFLINHGMNLGVENVEFNVERYSGQVTMKALPALFDKLEEAMGKPGALDAIRGVGPMTAKGIEFLKDKFEKPLFQIVLPYWKIEMGWSLYEKYTKAGLSVDEAGNLASKIVENVFGGRNVDELFRKKEYQDFFRIVALAPDFLESTIRRATGTVGAIGRKFWGSSKPQDQAYLKGVLHIMIAMMGMEALNYMSSGHGTWDNEQGHAFELQLGKDSKGRYRYLSFGSSLDFIRLPVQLLADIYHLDIESVRQLVLARTSTLLSKVIQMLSGVDYSGHKMFGKDQYGRAIPLTQQAASMLDLTLGFAVPQVGQAFLGLVIGKSSFEQFITQSFELPARYKMPTKAKGSHSLSDI